MEAFKLADNASSCYGVAGDIYGRVRLNRKGGYKIKGLLPGKYAVRAFLDSNNNGKYDNWESSGVAVEGGMQGPVIYTSFPAIALPTSRVLMNITLRDKDTDNDLLPDSWEFQHFGNLGTSGYDKHEPDLFVWEEYADGALDSDPNRVDTDGDGLSDAVELRLTGTDTHLVDTDFDGISDLEEFLSAATRSTPPWPSRTRRSGWSSTPTASLTCSAPTRRSSAVSKSPTSSNTRKLLLKRIGP